MFRSSPLKIFLLLSVLAVSCGRADSIGSYSPPENLAALGEWAQSGSLAFRVMKVAESKVLATQETQEKAPRGTRFVLVTVQVMVATRGEGYVDCPAVVRLVDSSGQGYRPNSARFTNLNPGDLPVKIEAGTFVERVVAFLVNSEFEPRALRCTGDEAAEPRYLALRRED
jgi:hypothetical protein